MKNIGLYVHIPFCKSKCKYCDFNSYAGMDECFDRYFSALNEEIFQYKNKNYFVDTIYFGGGTPTSVDTSYIEETMKTIFRIFKVAQAAENTIECNPKTADKRAFERLRKSKINRISIGLQSTNNEQLRALGRLHSAEDFEKSFKCARDAGFDNISLDLMYGLPDQTIKDWSETVNRAASYGAEHISCYSLKIEEGTPFAKMSLRLPDDDTVADMYDLCVETLGKYGYNRYEISNFSKEMKESRHNLKYWSCDDFIGFGAGAYSCVENERFSNETDVMRYIEMVEKKGCARKDGALLSREDKLSEFMFLGLRCQKGIELAEFERRFGCDVFSCFGREIEKYEKLGFLILADGYLRFADKAFFVSNTILADFV